MAIPWVIYKQSPCACIPLLLVLVCINTPPPVCARTLAWPANPRTQACFWGSMRASTRIGAVVPPLNVCHYCTACTTLLHACTGCLVVTIQSKIFSLPPLPTPLLSRSPVRPPLPPICHARLVHAGGGFPSPPAYYSTQLDKWHCLPPPTSWVCSCLFRSLCMHLLTLCQGEPLCVTCTALHRLGTVQTVLELKMWACAIICHWSNGEVQHLNIRLGSTISLSG